MKPDTDRARFVIWWVNLHTGRRHLDPRPYDSREEADYRACVAWITQPNYTYEVHELGR